MTLRFDDINWLAVAVAALATFMLGGLWYTALFGKKWAELHGYTEERTKEIQAKKPPAIFFGTMMACYIVVSIVVATLVTSFEITTVGAGAGLGLLLWLLAAAVGLTGHIAEDRHNGVYVIDTVYQLIYLVGIGALLAVWR